MKDRLKLIIRLTGLELEVFEILLATVSPTRGVISPIMAPQGIRVAQLIDWAQSEAGMGLSKLEEILDELLNSLTLRNSKDINTEIIKKEDSTVRGNLTNLSESDKYLYSEANDVASQINIKSDLEKFLQSGQSFVQLVQAQVEKLPKEKDSTYQSKIDAVNELLKEGRPKAAKLILLSLRDKLVKEGNLSNELNYQVTANLGVCAFELNDREVAIKEFKEALSYQPNKPEALSNAALAALLSQEYDEAIRLSNQARLLKDHNPQATSIYIQALYLQEKDEEIQRLLNEEAWIKEDPMCCIHVGQIKYDNNDYEEAGNLFRHSIEKNNKNPHSQILLARTIATSVRQAFRSDPPPPKRFPEVVKAKMQEAETALNYAINLLKEHDSRSLLHEAYLERSGILALLSRLDESLEDCNKILLEDPENLGAVRSKGTILLSKGRLKEAIECFKKVLSHVDDINTITLLGDAYLQDKQYKEAVALLSDLWEANTREYHQPLIVAVILEAQFYLGNYTEVNKVVQNLIENWPNDPNVLTVIAEQYERENKIEDAVTKYQEAIAHSTGNRYEEIVISLGDLYYSEEKYYEAAEAYGKVVNRALDNVLLRKYLFALYKINSYKEALEITQNIRANGKAIPFITGIEVSILYYIDDLEGAKELLIQLCELEPEKVSHQTMLLYIYVRLGQENLALAKEILSNIDYEEVKDDPITLVDLAKMSKLLGTGNELVYAFRARQIANDPEVHLAYVHLFFAREDPESVVFRPNEIGTDCVVTLKNDDETIDLTIVEDIPSNYEVGVINKSDEQACKLLGRSKGEKIIWKEGTYEEIIYEIMDIRSKYVAAFQDALNRFSFRFPKHNGLEKINVKDSDFTKLLVSMDERDKWVSEMERAYREKMLPLSVLAKSINASLVDVWSGMINSSKGRIFTQVENRDYKEQEGGILACSDTIVMDFTALLTLGHLKLLDKLANYFETIYVARPILDELNDIIDGDLTKRKTKAVSWKEGGYYNFREVTTEDLDKWYNFLQNIRDFVKSKTQVVGVKKILEIGKNEYERLSDTLGKEALASILVASEYKSLLYTDEFILRVIAQKWDVKSVCSQSFLMAIRSYQNALSEEEYYKLVKTLVLSNYHFIFISTNFLLWFLKEQNMFITEQVRKVFECFQGNNHKEDSALFILAELVRELWLQPIIVGEQGTLILFLILDTLVKNRSQEAVIRKFKKILKARCKLMLDLDTILSDINAWQQIKLSNGKVLM